MSVPGMSPLDELGPVDARQGNVDEEQVRQRLLVQLERFFGRGDGGEELELTARPY